MLSAAENDALCRVGPGTVMGDLLRQYWVPALVPREVPEPDCPPVRLRLLVENCNFMQSVEGDIDTVHFGFLHTGHVRPEDCVPNSPDYFAVKVRNFKSVVVEHAIGTTYGAARPATDTQDNWRIGNFLAPFYSQAATGTLTDRVGYAIWVPIDDEHTMVWNVGFPPQKRDPDATGVGGITFRGRD